jgi:putative transposase
MPHTQNPSRRGRRSIRLSEWDYTAPGYYFVTICTHERQNLFDDSLFRQVAERAWQAIPTQPHAQRFTLDEWVVMPNHLHGILIINEIGGRDGEDELSKDLVTHKSADEADAEQKVLLPSDRRRLQPGSIGSVVGNLKSLVARRINRIRGTPGARVWQRGYYDRIVRNQRELDAIRRYIRDNSLRWQEDWENLDVLLRRMRRVP